MILLPHPVAMPLTWPNRHNHATISGDLSSVARTCYDQPIYQVWVLYLHQLWRYESWRKIEQLGWFADNYGWLVGRSVGCLVGCLVDIFFQHKNRLYQGQGLGWRFSSKRLMMANDTKTSWPHCLFVQRQPKMGKDRIVLSYYAKKGSNACTKWF